MATGAASPDFSFESDSAFWKKLGAQTKATATHIASLRFTVILFAFSVALIFIGTLAQAQAGMNMWRVINEYFRSFLVMVKVSVFFVPGWFPELHKQIPDWLVFPFPGGFTIAWLMAANLVAAHMIRFKVQGKGFKLALGVGAVALGVAITYLVIASGGSDGLQANPPFEWSAIWYGVRGAVALCTLASVIALAVAQAPSIGTRALYVLGAVVFGGLSVVAWRMMPDESSLRVLWQLIQGGFSALILLMGCYLIFLKRAGIVLLHAGIGLIMFSEFSVSRYAEEGRMSLMEGETVNYVNDIREVELAIVDPSKAETDDVIVVPGSLLRPKRTLFGGTNNETVVVQDEALPFDIYVEQYMVNTTTFKLKEGDDKFATKGSGLWRGVKEIPAADGTESDVDFAAALVEFKKRDSDKSLGKYLLSQLIAAQDIAEEVTVDGKSYEVSLRFKREYKPYKISLKEARQDDYVGTSTPMNYSSDVVLTKMGTDGEQDAKVGEFHIWMNNPLRYSGETFYQSGYFAGSETTPEFTTLQVVRNRGWMMPYIGCMMVGVGMLFHFSGTLWRYLEKNISKQLAGQGEDFQRSWTDFLIPTMLVVIFGGYAISKFRPPTDTKANMKIHELGKLPVVFEGRVQPMDSLARNALRIVSNREYLKAAPYDQESIMLSLGLGDKGVKKPAIQWLLDVISGSPDYRDHRVFYIENLDIQKKLGLERRKRFRYAISEFAKKLPVVEEELTTLRRRLKSKELTQDELSLYQKKLFEFEERLRTVLMLQAAFIPQPLPPLATPQEFAEDREAAMAKMEFAVNTLFLRRQNLRSMHPPLVIPTADETDWEAFSTEATKAELAIALEREVDEATLAWSEMRRAYAATDVNAFNDAVFGYQELIANNTPTIKNAKGDYDPLNLPKLKFEHIFNSSQPFTSATVLYVVAFLLGAFGWAMASGGKGFFLRRGAAWIIALAFVIHTVALISRVYVSGRPPITNLYSSAIFIGWAAVGVGIVIEFFMRLGIGNALAAISGYSTLIIAYHLAADGDTFKVMRAVLDTNFWLATHVVCITLGYAATFVAGLLGIFYIASHVAFRSQTKVRASTAQQVSTATYGILCFAIFFSFIGTVLGGLWADDSWGRFWGWDPKENGALLIVLWNALILHARWGGLVRQKGIALLAIAGNIVTAWSWFGVNELGVGLHSYGFTEGVLVALGLFCLSQVAIIIAGHFLVDSYQKQKMA